MSLPQTDLTTLRELLGARLTELQAEVRTAVQAQREAVGDGGHEVSDRKDEAALRLLAEVDGAQQQRDLDELSEVEAALHRLDLGTYGDCVDCREPISLPRLRVQPAALRCAACQTAHEHASDR